MSARVRRGVAIAATIVVTLFGGLIATSVQTPVERPVDEKALREYTGVYQWEPNAFVYLQMWEEFSGFGKPRLVALDESGDVRVLYRTNKDMFVAGPGIAVQESIESRIAFQRDRVGAIVLLTWQRKTEPSRTARRVEIERREDVRFSNRDVQLAGTLIAPSTGGKHPAIVLVHGSGARSREHMLPFARFLIRRGIAVLGYDKRGVGESTGDWNTATYEDLAGDVVAGPSRVPENASRYRPGPDWAAGHKSGGMDYAARRGTHKRRRLSDHLSRGFGAERSEAPEHRRPEALRASAESAAVRSWREQV